MNSQNGQDSGLGEALLLLAGIVIIALCWRHIVHYLGGL